METGNVTSETCSTEIPVSRSIRISSSCCQLYPWLIIEKEEHKRDSSIEFDSTNETGALAAGLAHGGCVFSRAGKALLPVQLGVLVPVFAGSLSGCD